MKIQVDLEEYVRAKLTEFLTVDTNSDIIQPMTEWIVQLVESNYSESIKTKRKSY